MNALDKLLADIRAAHGEKPEKPAAKKTAATARPKGQARQAAASPAQPATDTPPAIARALAVLRAEFAGVQS